VLPSFLKSRLRAGEVSVLDVRPEEEYALGHVPGAVNIPLHELQARLAELPADKEIVAYCTGPTPASRFRPSQRFEQRVTGFGGLRTATRSGRLPVCPSKPLSERSS
jgi:hypothetical protein